MNLRISLRSYDKSRRIGDEGRDIPLETGEHKLTLGDGLCQARVRIYPDGAGLRGEAAFTFLKPTARASGVAVSLRADRWKRENYVFGPGAVYNGNRFACQKLPYPPYAQIPPEEALTAPAVITDIPHLSDHAPCSKIELRAGDLTTPAMGCYDHAAHRGLLLFTRQLCHGDDTGIAVYEDLNRETADFVLSVPAVREDVRYFFGEKADGSGFYPHMAPSDDTGRWFAAGETIMLPFAVFDFEAADLSGFFTRFNEVRACLETGELAESVPYGRAYEAVKAKFERENFLEEAGGGYYAVGVRRDIPQQCWQAGWTGGGMNNYAFLLEDRGRARERALETFRFIFDRLQTENGWVCGMYGNGVFYGDTFNLEHPNHVLLIRKDADLLYFALKQYLACPRELAAYREKLMALCSAFVRLYRKYGQIGQFVDTAADTIVVGNSACGAMAVGALALGWQAFGEKSYLETAEALASLYENDYLKKGVVNGCPGEICQAPDSEGAFALLESFVQLYEATGRERWLQCAKDAFELAVTWVVSYDFTFPRDSAAFRRNAHTLGTVFANAQNKHSAPGICTLSGSSLLKLYRFTGEEKYLYWLQAITRALMQFVSTEERPVFTLEGKYLPPGYVNERVQTSDWEGKDTIGGFLYGSNWPEVSVMLTYVEVPGVYANLSTGRAHALDSVRCGVTAWEPHRHIEVWVENPTAYDTVVTVLADDTAQRTGLSHNYFMHTQKIRLEHGQRIGLSIQWAENAAHSSNENQKIAERYL